MYEICDMKREFARMMTELQKVSRKMELAQSKFTDAARDKDRKRAEEARLEYATLQDRMFDIYWDAYGVSEDISEATLDAMFGPGRDSGSDHVH